MKLNKPFALVILDGLSILAVFILQALLVQEYSNDFYPLLVKVYILTGFTQSIFTTLFYKFKLNDFNSEDEYHGLLKSFFIAVFIVSILLIPLNLLYTGDENLFVTIGYTIVLVVTDVFIQIKINSRNLIKVGIIKLTRPLLLILIILMFKNIDIRVILVCSIFINSVIIVASSLKSAFGEVFRSSYFIPKTVVSKSTTLFFSQIMPQIPLLVLGYVVSSNSIVLLRVMQELAKPFQKLQASLNSIYIPVLDPQSFSGVVLLKYRKLYLLFFLLGFTVFSLFVIYFGVKVELLSVAKNNLVTLAGLFGMLFVGGIIGPIGWFCLKAHKEKLIVVVSCFVCVSILIMLALGFDITVYVICFNSLVSIGLLLWFFLKRIKDYL